MTWTDLYLINKVPNNRQAFGEKVIRISDEMGINPNWLMSLMHFETAGTMRSDITNSLGYTGLIQFGKSAAKGLGTTTAKLRKMSNVKQLDYVKLYFTKLWKSRLAKIKTITDLYLIIIFPVAVGKSDNWIIQHKTVSKYSFWKNNPAFRRGSKQYVTVSDIRSEILRRYPRFKGETPKTTTKKQTTPKSDSNKIAYYLDGKPIYKTEILPELEVTAKASSSNLFWLFLLLIFLSQRNKKTNRNDNQ